MESLTSNVYAFLSYAREDKPFADRLSGDLRAAGVRIWRDVDDIRPGTHWQREIERALAGSFLLLYVSSKNTATSGWMATELRLVLQRGAERVIPIILDDQGEANLPSDLAGFQWADFRPGYEQGFRALLSGLPSELKQEVPVQLAAGGSKGYVFISYAEEDSKFVASLRSFLKRQGYAYWDYAESDRDYHGQFFLEIEDRIKGAAATFSVLSPSWKQSEWAVQEYLFSKEVDTPVFLLKAQELGPTLPIAGRPFIDFTRDPKAGYQKLRRELRRKKL